MTGDDVLEGKPDPAIYRLAAERLCLPPSSLFAFEDAAAGVQSAIAAGIRCIGIAEAQKAATLRQSGAEHVVPDFNRLEVDRLADLHFIGARVLQL